MVELKEKACNYAEENVINVLKEAFAKVYADGYRDGYKDREEEIPVEFRTEKTEFVDLGLPSGTLWANNYEQRNGNVLYLPYEKAVVYNIPTTDQWKELFDECKWDFATKTGGSLSRADCAGPNGQVISFDVTGLIEAKEKKNSLESFFWIKEDVEGNEKKAVHIHRQKVTFKGMDYDGGNFSKELKSYFSGFKLPIRQVRKK